MQISKEQAEAKLQEFSVENTPQAIAAYFTADAEITLNFPDWFLEELADNYPVHISDQYADTASIDVIDFTLMAIDLFDSNAIEPEKDDLIITTLFCGDKVLLSTAWVQKTKVDDLDCCLFAETDFVLESIQGRLLFTKLTWHMKVYNEDVGATN